MIRIDGVYTEVRTDDVQTLAEFYERTFGFERLSAAPDSIVLGSEALYLRVASPAGKTEDQAPIWFAVAPTIDLETVRDEAVAGGAIVLSESKRDGVERLVCQDPAGNELVIVQRPEVRALPPAEVASPNPAPGGQEPVRPLLAARPAQRITRRDMDRLRDSERLASMQEAIAGLHVAFDPNDPAGVMDEMRSKIGPVANIDTERQIADEAMRAEQRAAEADEMLKRYRAALTPDPEPPPVTPAAAPAERDDEVEHEIPRTLGRSKDDDEAPSA